jgi:hypothetical protein
MKKIKIKKSNIILKYKKKPHAGTKLHFNRRPAIYSRDPGVEYSRPIAATGVDPFTIDSRLRGNGSIGAEHARYDG